MKKILITASFLVAFGFANAQEKKQDVKKENDLKTWYHKNFDATKVYGVNTEGAYQFFQSKKLKPTTVIVGVLDSGVEVDHPGLIKNMWTNPKEVANNGKDDDGNGYIDDMHGWNFIGGAKGDVNIDNLEVTRMVAKYQPIFEGKNSAKNKANQAKMPEEFKMYMKSKKIFSTKGARGKQMVQRFDMLRGLVPTMVKMLNGKNFTVENLKAIKPAGQKEMMALQIMGQVSQDKSIIGKTPAQFKTYIEEQLNEGYKHFESEIKQYDLNFDPRKEIVGDNYEDYSERIYGNNHYEGPDALHGTHVAGIIAGLAHDKEVKHGVAYKVAKIMTVRTVPDGDERDKDIANAIRYAVDNGATILNMSFGKPVSPGKKEVWKAFKYAEKKGVLLVKAAGNSNEDISEHIHYPTSYVNVTDAKPIVNNVLTVGASTKNPDNLRAGFSNYDEKLVDVFAPGAEIYSTVPDAKYRYLQGTSMASPVVAGAAAILKSYMPHLTPAQIIESLVKTSNKSTVNAHLKEDANADFSVLSRAGGVIDVKKAAEYAYTHFKKRSWLARLFGGK
ncbi:MAG: peptidase S8 [Flavobacteriales bacterium]|nr:MAG: peptidase S8 [Flavobacteriales bacterium]